MGRVAPRPAGTCHDTKKKFPYVYVAAAAERCTHNMSRDYSGPCMHEARPSFRRFTTYLRLAFVHDRGTIDISKCHLKLMSHKENEPLLV